MSDRDRTGPHTIPDTSDLPGASPEEIVTQAVSSASEAIPSASDATDAIPEAAGELISGALEVASGGSSEMGRAILDQTVESATDLGVGAISSALDRAGVPGASAISQAIGQAAQITQSVVRQATSRRQEEATESSDPPARRGTGSGSETSASPAGDGDSEQVRVVFEVEDEAEVVWDVAQLAIDEKLNQPYEARVELRTDQLDAEPGQLLGANAAVLIERGDLQQRCPGLIVKVVEGAATGDYLSVQVTLAPALRLLGQRRDTRIFQLMTVPEILEQILGETLAEYDRDVELSLERRTYPVREHCTQYDETDLDFAHRLMEEEGIAYRFDTEGDRELMVLFDRSSGAGDIESTQGAALQMTEYGSSVGGHELVARFQLCSQMRPTRLALRCYDWTRTPRTTSPSASPEESRPIEALREGSPAAESDPPDGASLGPAREAYDHDDQPATLAEYDDASGLYGEDDAEDQATVRRELQARDARVGQGSSTAIGLRPGLVFELQGHRQGELDGRYLLTEVRHTFMVSTQSIDERYVNEFTCVPVDVPFRPARVTPKPRVSGLQTATVVGPSGEEIHTDQHGRVKVQFHWDRQGVYDENSSCWVRVRQPWAGAGWGFVFLPRIGMEVTVAFVSGDPDRPVVTGTLYNGVNHPPLDLDEQKTRSSIRTRSSVNSEGYNELTFEDLAGSEQIIVHAQKDYNETVENNHSTTVHSNQTNSIDGNQSESVGGNQSLSVSGNRTKNVDREETITVTQKRETTIDGLEKNTFNASREVHITGTDSLDVSARQNETINGGRRATIAAGDEVHVTSGNSIANVDAGQYLVSSAKQMKLVQGETHFLRLDGFAKLGTTGVVTVTNETTTIEGDIGGTLTLSADSEIKLLCGAGSISIKSDGTVEITGTKVELKSGNSGVTVESSGSTVTGGTTTISGSSMVNISATVVKIN